MNKKNYCLYLICIALFMFVATGCDETDTEEVFVSETFTVSGNVTGLDGDLELQNNGGDTISVSGNGPFSFTTALNNGDFYNVTITSRPETSLTCNMSKSSGVISGADVSDVSIVCSDPRLRDSYGIAVECKNCHMEEYYTWAQSGHGYKLSKITDEELPIFPFSDMNVLFSSANEITFTPNGDTYTPTLSNTSYIIGGFGWKARYMNSDGRIVHGDTAQYNIVTDSFVAYGDSGTEASVDYNCGFCHVTGWESFSGDASRDESDLLVGMDGRFEDPAITCQRCHVSGNGHYVKHMKANEYQPNGASAPATVKSDTTADIDGNIVNVGFGALDSMSPSNTVCSDCHVRGDSRYIVPVSGGLIKHHEQAHTLYVGKHPGSCMTCHDPHASVKYDSLAKGDGIQTDKIVNGNCGVSCHSDKKINPKYSDVHTCLDCHMPYVVKSAVTYTTGDKPVGGATLGIPGGNRGDIRAHIFALGTDTNPSQLENNLDGSTGQVKLAVEFSCMTCHGAGGSKGPTNAYKAETLLNAYNVHNW